MNKLVLKMKYPGKRWSDYLPEIFGNEVAGKLKIETNATANTNTASIILCEFKNEKNIIEKITNNENILSAFLVKDNKVCKIFK